MSELINTNDNRATIRWKLLTGASALALTAYVSSAGLVKAEDQPQVWIELGGQLNRLSENTEAFAPVFPSSPSRPAIFSPSQKFEKPAVFGIDEFASLSFQPEDSDWIFSASIKYGRAVKNTDVRQQTFPSPITFDKYPTNPNFDLFATARPYAARFAETSERSSERHTILDFQAGKDVGLGMFGAGSSSTVSLGVRIAQFSSKSNITLNSDPDWHFKHKYFYSLQTIVQPYHSNSAGLSAQRSFRGIGPSLSWNASAPFAGNAQDGELTLDWGINVAALFGRQKTRTQHHTTVRYNNGGYGFQAYNYGTPVTVTKLTPAARVRSRNVTVPNVGGSVGLSWRLQNFKMSLGYRYDTFLNAMDTGIDATKKSNVTFNGPYASISIGIGN